MAVCANSGTQNEEIKEVTTKQFRRFDVVTDDSDHLYRNHNQTNKNKDGDYFTNASSGVHKKIMKEWKVLEENLPELIYVRVYERRIDLLRAAIVGPAGTPYHDGLFFFDLAFPPDYPSSPPQVRYWSFGLRLNPNLYTNGLVCLSLLNTWHGKKNERWNPSESTVLQLLLSVQGLVLNEKPYFNIPGIAAFPGQGKKSMAYNDNVFILSCKTMVYLLRRTPKNFEDLVHSHFRDRAHDILTACNAFMDGRARVGHTTDNGSISSSSWSSVSVSSKFKAAMKSWYPQMVVALGRTGASLESFLELRVEKETALSKQVKKEKNKSKTASFNPLVIKKWVKKVIGESHSSPRSKLTQFLTSPQHTSFPSFSHRPTSRPHRISHHHKRITSENITLSTGGGGDVGGRRDVAGGVGLDGGGEDAGGGGDAAGGDDVVLVGGGDAASDVGIGDAPGGADDIVSPVLLLFLCLDL
ncbi:hypothetical protein F0562_034925 [Nyssa sinensis]|uniref:UBC core domain-containing protein n=1 Tax=Nyssa sinensis TaxID=561372 RepID=A0A5J5AA05_9ASTE|nr:hypothetical protein F0562_034925 [Nyssa sinensis]